MECGAVPQCLHSGYKLLVQLPCESISSFSCVCCPSKLKAEMPRYRLYAHEKNGMRQFTNVGKWYFCHLGTPPGNPSDGKIVCKACYKRLQCYSTREKEDGVIQIELQVSFFPPYITPCGNCNNSL